MQSVQAMVPVAVRRRWRWLSTINTPLLLGGILALALIICAVAAPFLALHDPLQPIPPEAVNGKPPPYPPGTPGLPLGSDILGRDMVSRLLYAARYTLLFAGTGALARLLIGITLGMLAGWYPRAGKPVAVLLGTSSAIPSLFFALGLILIFFRRADLTASTILYLVAVSLTGWAEIAVQCRTAVQSLANAPFIEAASVIGQDRRAILWRHIFPNLRDLLLVEASYTMAGVLLLIAELGFLGFYLGTPEVGVSPVGIQADPIYPEWGSMLAIGLRRRLQGSWMLLEPLLVFTLAILTFNLLAEGLRWGRGRR